jgi:hypothetical protein
MAEAENPLRALVDGNYLTSITLKSDGAPFIEYAFSEPFACDTVYLQLDRQMGAVQIEVQAEDDAGKPRGKKGIHVAEAEMLNHDEVASAESFIPFFRAQSAARSPFPPAAFGKDVIATPPPGWTVPGDQVIDLTAQVKDGKLDWDAPAKQPDKRGGQCERNCLHCRCV